MEHVWKDSGSSQKPTRELFCYFIIHTLIFVTENNGGISLNNVTEPRRDRQTDVFKFHQFEKWKYSLLKVLFLSLSLCRFFLIIVICKFFVFQYNVYNVFNNGL